MHDPVFDIFCEEAKEHLGALEKGFLDLEAAALPEARRGKIDSLFRHAHSLKGDARAIGLAALQEAAQRLEDILDALRNTPEKVNREVINQGLAQLDIIRQAFEAWQRTLGEEKAPAEPLTPTEVRDRGVRGDKENQLLSALAPQPSSLAPHPTPSLPEESFTVRVPSDRLDRMLNLAGELRIVQRSGEELSQRLADLTRFLTEMLDTCERLEQIAGQGLEQTDVQATAQAEIVNLRPQLEGCRDQVGRVENSLRKKRNREDILLETLDADIQQARLLPLIMLTDSLRRAVRDLGQSLAKSIRYEVDVGSVVLDKAVLEALRDPMLHLLRNAASHGIEPSEERRASGKPPEGVIRVQAARRGNGVRILVSDDGRGVDYNRIRARVRQTEGLGEAELAALTKEQLARYLFKPGFTTAGPRDAISGRGVGLDVVLNTVHRLHGTVLLESSSSQGTTFAITVPVSLSTIRILTVLDGGQYYGIPTTLIENTGRVKYADLRELEGCPVLPINGEPVRWFPLKALLGITTQPLVSNQPHYSYVLIQREGGHVAVAVDDMEEEAEVLLKPLGFPLRDLPGIVGAAVRPDGSVQIVLDLSGASFKPAVGLVTKSQEVKPSGRILVVDDSPTTRTILRNVFTAAGYFIRTASDGVDALERLRAEPVDLVISDVEMPRMDGFELTRQVKAKHHLPVILVTAMEKEEHRRKGLEAGADAYVVKSTFQGKGLLEIVKQFI
jgi:two-component system, chemotaxis family, sensor kinase CheA